MNKPSQECDLLALAFDASYRYRKLTVLYTWLNTILEAEEFRNAQKMFCTFNLEEGIGLNAILFWDDGRPYIKNKTEGDGF